MCFVFGAAHIPSVLVAATSDHSGDDRLYYPVVGPWIDLADRTRHDTGPRTGTETTNKVLLAADGVFQVVGALSIVAGLVYPETRVSYGSGQKPTWQLSPVRLGRNGYGLAALGRF